MENSNLCHLMPVPERHRVRPSSISLKGSPVLTPMIFVTRLVDLYVFTQFSKVNGIWIWFYFYYNDEYIPQVLKIASSYFFEESQLSQIHEKHGEIEDF